MSIHIDALRDIACNGWPVCDEAADEIERLEQEIEQLRAQSPSPSVHRQASAEDERTTFEVWAGDQGFLLERTVSGDDYQDLRTQGPWDAWRARAALPSSAPQSRQASAVQEGVTEGAPRNWRTILSESEANFARQFGTSSAAAWVYRDLEDLFASLHDKRCPAALNFSDPCNCGATS